MVMEEKDELPSEEGEEEKSAKFRNKTKGSSSNPSPRTGKDSSNRKPRAQMFQLFRMVPPIREGI